MQNPLLKQAELPPFNSISAEQIKPAIESILANNEKQLDKLLTQKKFTWKNLLTPLETMHDKLDQSWSTVEHLHAVMNSEALRQAYSDCLPLLTAYYSKLGQNKALYQAIQSLKSGNGFKKFDQAQKQIINHELRDFKLSGVALSKAKKEQFTKLQQSLAKYTTQYENNLLDANNHWFYRTRSKTKLKGIPATILAVAKQTAKQKNLSGFVLTLDAPVYQAVSTYAESQPLRKLFYEAYCTRASDKGPDAGKFDNSELMRKILNCRQKVAKLVGFKSYAAYSLTTKMAKNTQQVIDFLEDLVERIKPVAKKELAELKRFAKEAYRIKKLNAWDLNFYSEKLRQHKYNISQETLRAYFPEKVVMKGMFKVVKKLYGVDVKEVKKVDKWHKDAKCYAIYNKRKKLIARFFVDLYARPNKRGGAWMAECRNRKPLANGKVQVPVAYLTCNFTPAVKGKPCLLTHDEVVTMFHEFGHGLHHMLTTVDYPFVAGISGVSWDAVELPSQFMENFCWQEEVLAFISKHHKTGKPLSKGMLKKMLAAKNFQSGMGMLRQIEFALFDMSIHLNYKANTKDFIQKTLDEVRSKVAVFKPPRFNRFQHGFSHIFAGGYAAGYYSYKWAEVLSSDAFARFEEEGLFNPIVSKAFLENILQKGGSEDAAELFKAFRGREPEIDSLLKHSGIL